MPDTATTESFDRLASRLDWPMLIVTTRDDHDTAGCLVGFWSQSSISPTRVAVFLSKKNHTFMVAQRATTLAAHVLHDRDFDLARHFGEETDDEVDKFSSIRWTAGPDNVPVIDGLDWFSGTICDQHDCGDHVAFILEPAPGHGCADRADEPPLTSSRVQHLSAGHAP
ncbi:MAG: flavin reductase [Acidimicrobiia bacterium]|nr:flavin reductase [Acidimicrobiia bacterium]